MKTTRTERLALLQHQIERLEARRARRELKSNYFAWQQVMALLLGFVISFVLLAIFRPLGVLAILGAIAYFYYSRKQQVAYSDSALKLKNLVQFYETQVARATLDWEHIPAVPARSEQSDHPFENDLDISGEYSLHQLLNTAFSHEGSLHLRKWLLQREPDLETIQQRQALVRELTTQTRFRHKLAFHSLYTTRYMSELFDAKRILLWLAQDDAPRPPRYKLLVPCVLTVILLASLLLYALGILPVMVPLVSLLVSVSWSLFTMRDRLALFADASFISQSFAQLGDIFGYLEHYPYQEGSRLQELCAPFAQEKAQGPTHLLTRLRRLARMASFSQDQVGALFLNAILPWDAYIADQLALSKQVAITNLPQWLSAWFELEALCSLANFAYLNPEYTLPEVVAQEKRGDAPLLQGTALGHPLLEPEGKVTNDVSFARQGDVMLITGSNMAGKSTFLRTVGLNLCLAYAGGPVNAASLRTTLFELCCCIRVVDSVTDGYSYFYAEVRRLRQILSRLQGQPRYPLFFLIDEIFKGTNNRERLIGSHAYIYALAGQHCLGAISTHDLELVALSDELPQIYNYHFREHVIKGKMSFDYCLRTGPCPTSNALKIMRLEGLPISWPGAPAVPAQLEEV
ncbi:DNA mismatch repair protein [Ktedonobacter sp. SOSP1-52]|uniref:MutS-related protein n=1 Tax=Ktedonobacter sp. SOSP1-52 TaxID=2778366 RepID=UPI00191544A3|nr:hypothetical protein [Ktedonobacter sp. SOSP1-52]GHO68931.1 DNA mismatch repair protein [Ktedonobacter sp. SOSP1-52]